MIIEKLLGGDVFSWGGRGFVQEGNIRAAYLHALREADKGNFEFLMQFARS